MSDRFPAEITIGGNIPRRLLDELAGMIASLAPAPSSVAWTSIHPSRGRPALP